MKTIIKIVAMALCAALLIGGAVWFVRNHTSNTQVTTPAVTTETTTAEDTRIAELERQLAAVQAEAETAKSDLAKAEATLAACENAATATDEATTATKTTSDEATKAEFRQVTEPGSETKAWHLFGNRTEVEEFLSSATWCDLAEKFIAVNNGMNFYQTVNVKSAKADGTYVGWWTAEDSLVEFFDAHQGVVGVKRADGRFVSLKAGSRQEAIRVNDAEAVRGIGDRSANDYFVQLDDGRWVLDERYASNEVYAIANIDGTLSREAGFVSEVRLGQAFGLQQVAENEYRLVLYVVAAPAPVVTSAPVQPTAAPTAAPTTEPTEEPTVEPTQAPTVEPTVEPTQAPTVEPTAEPAHSTPRPTDAHSTPRPTEEPTPAPTTEPAHSQERPADEAEETPSPYVPSSDDYDIRENVVIETDDSPAHTPVKEQAPAETESPYVESTDTFDIRSGIVIEVETCTEPEPAHSARQADNAEPAEEASSEVAHSAPRP